MLGAVLITSDFRMTAALRNTHNSSLSFAGASFSNLGVKHDWENRETLSVEEEWLGEAGPMTVVMAIMNWTGYSVGDAAAPPTAASG